MKSEKLDSLPTWLESFDDTERKGRIWEIGLLTGWRHYADGSYGAPNYERGLLVDRIVELTHPATILEIGTGRGLGAIAMVEAGRRYGVDLAVTTIDMLPSGRKQEWPIRREGADSVIRASRDEVWNRHFDSELTERIEQLTGLSTSVMPQLAAAGRKFDFIFIDGGHDPYAVISDVAWGLKLLRPGGVVLMDDFAPQDEYGIGTCLALPHLRNWFESVEVFHTEGLVYGGAENPAFPRGMTLLRNPKSEAESAQVSSLRLLWWRVVNRVFHYTYSRNSFPLK